MTPPDEVGLPEELEAAVREVVQGTGLPLPEREEVAAELRAHFEDGLASGRTPQELLARFGDAPKAAGWIREARAGSARARSNRLKRTATMGRSEAWSELRRALRTLIREPGFSLVVVLTLALGVGANTAIFTVLDAVLIKPLPYDQPERLVRLYDVWKDTPTEPNEYLRGPGITAYQGWDEVFEGVASLYTYREMGADLTDGDVPERVVTSRVSAGYFEVLGAKPSLGRTFTPDESSLPGEYDGDAVGARSALLSHALWQRRFRGERQVVGRVLELDGEPYQIVGVMPKGFQDPLGSRADLWIPQDLTLGGSNNWENHDLTGVARLRGGLSLEVAQERVNALNDRLVESEPDNAGWSLSLRPLHRDLVGERRGSLLWVLAGAVALILLSACVNVGNIVFTRSLGRDRDIALRGALGSGRGRLLVHLLSESVLLALMGGLAGLLLGSLGIRGLLAIAPDALPAIATPRLSPRVFLFGLGSSVAALLAFGLAPALRLSATPPAEVLRSGGRSGTESKKFRRLRSALVVAQVAVAVVLVAGAGLLLRSLVALQAVDLAIDDSGVLTFEVHLPEARYGDGAARQRFHDEFQERVAGLPGVEAVGAISWLPANGRYNSWGIAWRDGWDGSSDLNEATWLLADVRVATGEYFGALGIDLLRGLPMAEADLDGEPVVWVNRALAERLELGGSEILGTVLRVGATGRRVVGIVASTPHDPRGAVSEKVYLPHAQFADDRNWPLIQTVKARGDLGSLRERIRSELAGLDAQLVLFRARPLENLLAGTRAQERFAALLMTIFAGLALTLAAVGSYGVLAENVARRRREIGIRMALGADPASVRGLVLGSALRMTLTGVAVGMVAAWLGSRWLSGLLFQVTTGDPVAYLVGGGSLIGLGALAAWLPARRATRVDPADSLAAD